MDKTDDLNYRFQSLADDNVFMGSKKLNSREFAFDATRSESGRWTVVALDQVLTGGVMCDAGGNILSVSPIGVEIKKEFTAEGENLTVALDGMLQQLSAYTAEEYFKSTSANYTYEIEEEDKGCVQGFLEVAQWDHSWRAKKCLVSGCENPATREVGVQIDGRDQIIDICEAHEKQIYEEAMKNQAPTLRYPFLSD